MFWMVFDVDGERRVLIQPASALIYARLAAAMAGLVDGQFLEALRLEETQIRRMPKAMVGKLLTAEQAEALLKKFGAQES